MLELSAVKNIRVEREESLLRPSDEPIILGDNGKLRQQTGWQPEIPITQTIRDMFQYWRADKG
jgi:GDP-4-dehydro-6-deoxy-D-mannose reductase